MGDRRRVNRREFLKVSAGIGGGFLIALYLPGCGSDKTGANAATADPKGTFNPNAWVRIAPDGQVTIEVGSSEMGQGVMTAIPMLLAEELDADWEKVSAEFAPADKAYTNPIIGQQLTGGSSTVRSFWRPVREAGAAAREMLIQAAAETWGVAPDSCQAERGTVVHPDSGRRLPFGELTAKAATLQVPETVLLKDPADFRLLGRALPRLDTPAKVDGSAVFGQDVSIPGMVTAMVVRCPVFGGKVKTFDATAAQKVKGVQRIFPIESGIAVVADGYWAAHKARQALKVTWDEGPHAKLDDSAIRTQFKQAINKGAVARREGQGAVGLHGGGKMLEAEYEVPYLAHACMEPMNCTADVRKDGCEIWVPTQAQTRTQQTARRITGLPPEKIKVHTTFLGGGFGRRSEQDFVADAVAISKAVGAPVKVLWMREDDTQHDFYRPATLNHFAAALDEKGMPVAWSHKIAGPSIMARVAPQSVKNGIDRTSVEGAANLPYAIPNLEVTYAMVDPGVPVGFWRSVGSSQNAFVTECFLDEIAHAGGQDPYELRLKLLENQPRHRQVLKLAANKAGWGNPLPKGRHRGIAVAKSFGSYVAEVAEISLDGDQVRVHRVVCAIDCGMTVNPGIIEAQMESGIVYGLTAALKGEINIENGRVKQSNFNDYPLLTIAEMPKVEVYILPSVESPGGVGEPGTPPIAPAVANAVFAATGRPVRSLPIRIGASGGKGA
jgi:isoquinoline 1-oxidoreductase beta subunit